MFRILILVVCLVGVRAPPGHEEHGLDHHKIEEAIHKIHDLHLHFGEKQCENVLLLDCKNVHIHGDEQLCGSDRRTYHNHCEFAHAMCMFKHLHIAHHGACHYHTTTQRPTTTAAPTTESTTVTSTSQTKMPEVTTTAVPTTSSTTVTAENQTKTATTPKDAPTTTASVIQTNAPVVNSSGPVIPQGSMIIVTLAPDTAAPNPISAAPITTTQSPETILFMNVFCRNMDKIICPNTPSPVCGSDGKIYNTDCHFSKAKCGALTLSVLDMKSCSSPVSG